MAKKFTLGFGVDIGGSGIKGAPVDLSTGQFLAKRYRIPTPQPSTPKEVAKTVKKLVKHFDLPEDVPVGIAFPAPIVRGVVTAIANLDQEWKGTNIAEVMSQKLGRPVSVLNDADAAGFAEALYGAAHGIEGTVIVLTLGTGIGSALVRNGHLVPNTELGHLIVDGVDAESRASSAAFERENLTYEEWAERLQRYLDYLEFLFSPDLFIIGGGISKNHEEFIPLLRTRAQIVPAELLNSAGIVGAALRASLEYSRKEKKKKK